MIFSKNKNQDLPFVPTIYNHEIIRKFSARFLGVIMNQNLTWNDHILAIKAKMSRYVGILFKLKKILPLSARINIFHSFVQSQLTYCSLVWGLGPKSSIEKLFTEQKKAVRSLMPGFQLNYHKDGKNPTHTKSFFTKYMIPTAHSNIFINVLIFMFKYHYYKHTLPLSVANIIRSNSPRENLTMESCMDWLSNYPTGYMRNSISFKGPLFFSKYLPGIESKFTKNITSASISIKSSKNYAKSFVLSLQSEGRDNEWEWRNMPLNYTPGLCRGSRENIVPQSYTYD